MEKTEKDGDREKRFYVKKLLRLRGKIQEGVRRCSKSLTFRKRLVGPRQQWRSKSNKNIKADLKEVKKKALTVRPSGVCLSGDCLAVSLVLTGSSTTRSDHPRD